MTCTTARCCIPRRWCSRPRWRWRRRSAVRGPSCWRPRSPATRSASASANSSAARITHLPHHRHRRHARRRGGGGPAARPRRRADGACLRLGRHAGRRPLGIPARSRRLEAAAHRARRGGGTDGGLPRADGFTGAQRIFEGSAGHGRRHVARRRSGAPGRPAGHALGAGRDLVQVPRVVPAHASGRRCLAAGDAEHRLRADDIEAVTAQVHQGAIDVLGPVVDPQTVHQSKFSMGTVLGLIAQCTAAPA